MQMRRGCEEQKAVLFISEDPSPTTKNASLQIKFTFLFLRNNESNMSIQLDKTSIY